jgi:hypothetical protein
MRLEDRRLAHHIPANDRALEHLASIEYLQRPTPRSTSKLRTETYSSARSQSSQALGEPIPNPPILPCKTPNHLTPNTHHNHHNARPLEPRPTATSHPNPQLRPRPLHRLHDVEGPLRGHRLPLPHRRRALRINGTRIPTRRPIISLEQGRRHTNWRNRRV